jgi:hypothetical protein
LNFDLQDFFGTINFGRVSGYFQKDSAFQLPEEVANTIAHIACYNGSLPQGSPCSPVISNLIAHILDLRMLRFAEKTGCRYSRYADDITFSTNQKVFPERLASKDIDNSSVWNLSEDLVGAVTRAGFKIHPKKTRMNITGSRQEVTGLITNHVVNIKREYWLTTRAMCDRLFREGQYVPPKSLQESSPVQPTKNLSILEGRLSHIFNVKRHSIDPGLLIKTNNADDLSSFERTYGQFLFYKLFVALNRPLVVTEGPSDRVFVRTALKERKKKFSALFHAETNSPVFSLLKVSLERRRLLSVAPGTSGQGELIRKYRRTVEQFGAKEMKFPVIILTDNDKSAQDNVFGKASKMQQDLGIPSAKMNISSADQFVYLGYNLYLIKIPHAGDASEKTIESLIPDAWLKAKYKNKIFDVKKPNGSATHLSKMDFASQVIEENSAQIDFSKFDPLFDLLVKVLEDYRALQQKNAIVVKEKSV